MIYSQIFHQILYFPSQFYFLFENFKISENNIISVELAQVLQYCPSLLSDEMKASSEVYPILKLVGDCRSLPP
jgi:hypothetical protein